MQQNVGTSSSINDIAAYFNNASLPSQQETLGSIVVEILRSGRNLNRKAICTKLLSRLELASTSDEEHHYHQLIALLFGRD
ncbi:regulatory protein YcgZ [Pantoea sp. NPDC088449]|uniref:Biofilm development protein YmgB/AriR n=1 Tax=Candidatus Pantoea floridensis TaxID=1938870 RepID=A0A286DP12_9GAMM|nr:regulatory protein YcgZ [Pantoea floridensis]PIF15120.1 biofilm development protein YmgB/AriR [Enterobacteriaceae bacterium JKS000233]SOD60343.1 Biofilm development protein YmgB/AriR [Pantoea floridensis]